MSTFLITGGAGFIGSNLVLHALEHTGDRLVVVDKLTYAGSLLNLEGALSDPRVRFVQADIADREAMARVFAETQPDGRPQPGRRDARGPVDRRSPRLHRHEHRRHVRAARNRPAVRRRPARAGRGTHFASSTCPPTRCTARSAPRACSARRPPTRRTRRTRPARRRPITWSRAYFHTYRLPVLDHELLEQLRAVPVSREAHPAGGR